MNWLKLFQKEERSYYGDTIYSPQYYWDKRKSKILGYEVYQAFAPYNHVFLGSSEDTDIDEVEFITGLPICKRLDVRNMPEHNLWSETEYNLVLNELFKPNVQNMINLITKNKCPVYIHCEYGISRSVSVLAAALSLLSKRDVNSILSEMKTQRGMVGPHDTYYLMALETSGFPKETLEELKNEFSRY